MTDDIVDPPPVRRVLMLLENRGAQGYFGEPVPGLLHYRTRIAQLVNGR